MKKDQVLIGQLYAAKITDKIVPVRIDAEHKDGGWTATNTQTNRKVRIKTAQKLRNKIGSTPKDDSDKPATRQAVKKKLSAAERKKLLAQHKADQENARLREEREASPEGMTASEAAMSKSAGKKRTKKAKDAPANSGGKLSLIAAAAQVLAKAKKPMTTKEMVDQVVAAGLWTPGAGKTPHATLYSAILRDLKSETPRFEKVDRGQFTLAKGA
ncbi:MAG: HTH domain-containing protein [Phycisphaeraceae bacterium]